MKPLKKGGERGRERDSEREEQKQSNFKLQKHQF